MDEHDITKFSKVISANTKHVKVGFRIKRSSGSSEMVDVSSILPYDNSDLTNLANSAFDWPCVREFREQDLDKLLRFVERIDELRHKATSQPNFEMPTLNLGPYTYSNAEMASQLTDNWDSLIMRLRPFVHEEDLPWARIVNLVLGVRAHEKWRELKSKMAFYCDLSSARTYRDAAFCRKGNSYLILSTTNYKLENGEIFALTHTMPYNLEGETDYQLLSEQEKELCINVFDSEESKFTSADGWHVQKVMNQEFCHKWLKKFEYHPDADSDFHNYMYVPFAKWLVRYYLMYGLLDMVMAVNYLGDLAVDGLGKIISEKQERKNAT